MLINEAECLAAGVDPAKVKAIASRLSRCGKELKAMGLEIFGGSGNGQIRAESSDAGSLVLAHVDGVYNGGDGATDWSHDGLERGEC